MAVPTRREPPPFRRVEVGGVERLGPRMTRVTLTGDELEGLAIEQPAASVRLLLPDRGSLVVPTWQGNEFLLQGGRRPTIRTFTPRRFDPSRLELDLDIVIHGDSAASMWATDAAPGDPAAVSGPGRGYVVDSAAPAFLLAGDETAIPAVSQLLEVIPDHIPVDVHIEIAAPAAELPLPGHPRAVVHWHVSPAGAAPGDALVAAVEQAEVPPGGRAWVAGEAAAVQRIRRHLFEERDLTRSQATVRGYWKRGRSASTDADA